LNASTFSHKIAFINIICGNEGDIEKVSLIALFNLSSIILTLSLFDITLNIHALNQYIPASFVQWLHISITITFLFVFI